MKSEDLLKGDKKAFRDLYNMLIKHAATEDPSWSDVVEEYANIIEAVKDTELEKFVAGIGLNILVELERKWERGRTTV